LDLANLLFADEAGLQLLRELIDSERVQLKATPPFLAALLAANPLNFRRRSPSDPV